jgi:hypothetical protein
VKREEVGGHLQQIDDFMQKLLIELEPDYGEEKAYRALDWVFKEHFHLVEKSTQVKAKTDEELSQTSLQSLDDIEVSYLEKRRKRSKVYNQYHRNL